MTIFYNNNLANYQAKLRKLACHGFMIEFIINPKDVFDYWDSPYFVDVHIDLKISKISWEDVIDYKIIKYFTDDMKKFYDRIIKLKSFW